MSISGNEILTRRGLFQTGAGLAISQMAPRRAPEHSLPTALAHHGKTHVTREILDTAPLSHGITRRTAVGAMIAIPPVTEVAKSNVRFAAGIGAGMMKLLGIFT